MDLSCRTPTIFSISCMLLLITSAKVLLPLWEPTSEEINRALLVRPSSCWGRQMRLEQSVRILCLGGSNTDTGVKWPTEFNLPEYLKKWSECLNDSLRTHHPHMKSYVMNLGMGGMGPEGTMWDPYPFESWPGNGDDWPNLVILEFGVNCLRERDLCLQVHDRLIHSINHRYGMRGLPIPSYLILEYFTFRILYDMMEKQNDTIDNRINAFREYDKSNLRMQNLPELARFYRFPMISLSDALSPAAIRHFIHSKTTKMWHYSYDGTHLNHNGSLLVVNKILYPFISNQIIPRKGESRDLSCRVFGDYHFDYYDPGMYYDLSVFKSTITWSALGEDPSLNQIVKPQSNLWHFLYLRGHEDDDGHRCFGSEVKGSRGVFHIEAPKLCRIETPCMLRIQYIHSWNTSYIGGATCSLKRIHQHGGKALVGSSIIIQSNIYNGLPVKDTTPREIYLPNISKPGSYNLECINKEDRLSCINLIRLFTILPEEE